MTLGTAEPGGACPRHAPLGLRDPLCKQGLRSDEGPQPSLTQKPLIFGQGLTQSPLHGPPQRLCLSWVGGATAGPAGWPWPSSSTQENGSSPQLCWLWAAPRLAGRGPRAQGACPAGWVQSPCTATQGLPLEPPPQLTELPECWAQPRALMAWWGPFLALPTSAQGGAGPAACFQPPGQMHLEPQLLSKPSPRDSRHSLWSLTFIKFFEFLVKEGAHITVTIRRGGANTARVPKGKSHWKDRWSSPASGREPPGDS